jgi:hypothetical protein
LRPRARRARRTARPPLVRIRRRKPWVFARLRLLGWYVRFKGRAPSRRSRPVRSGGPCGRRKRPSVRVRCRPAQCGAARIQAILLVWGKPPRPLVAQGRRCYVARSLGRRRAVRLFRCVTARPRPNPCNTSGVISTPVDSPVDNW